MAETVKQTKVACRPILYLEEEPIRGPEGEPMSVGKALELRGRFEGRVTEYCDHRGRVRYHLELTPLNRSAVVCRDFGDPEPVGLPMPFDGPLDAPPSGGPPSK